MHEPVGSGVEPLGAGVEHSYSDHKRRWLSFNGAEGQGQPEDCDLDCVLALSPTAENLGSGPLSVMMACDMAAATAQEQECGRVFSVRETLPDLMATYASE